MNENMINQCLACCKLDNLINMKETHEKQSWRLVLFYCIPELKEFCLDIEFFLCATCLDQLHRINIFKSTCIQSYKKLADKSTTENSKFDPSQISAELQFKPVENANKIKQEVVQISKIDCDVRIIDTKKTKRKKTNKCESNVSVGGSVSDGNMCEVKKDCDSSAAKVKVKRGRKTLPKVIAKCSVCDEVFRNKFVMRRHVEIVHAAEKTHTCDICGDKFASGVYLAKHIKYHIGERAYICSICGKGYITASDLLLHDKTHANKRAYKCIECPKTYNTTSDLSKHKMAAHADPSCWKYVCTFCSRRFPLKTNLDTHTKRHTGERNFACHLCERRCINQAILKRHLESHSNVRLHKCAHCDGHDYKMKKSLDIHLKQAHGIGNAKVPQRSVRKFACELCPKSYFDKSTLQKHMCFHTGVKPYSCRVCHATFTDKSYVKKHLRLVHGQVDP